MFRHDSITLHVSLCWCSSSVISIRNDLAVLESTTVPLSCPPISSLLTPSENVLEHFKPLSVKEVEDIIKKYPETSCELDPIPSKLLVKIQPSILPTITDILNKCICSGQFPGILKTAIVRPLLKKPSLDCEVYKNYRPVSNLYFLSKTIERAIAAQITKHLKENHLLEELQSAYKIR